MIMRKLAVFFLVFAAVVSASAQTLSNEVLGFGRIIQDPAATGRGFAGRASTHSPAWSAWMNSAAIPFSDAKMDIGVAYQHWSPSAMVERTIAAGASGHFGIFGISAGFMTRSGDPYEIIDMNGVPSGQFTPRDIIGCGGLAIRILPYLSIGVDMRYVHQQTTSNDALAAFSADVLLMAKFGGFTAAAGIANVGGRVTDSDGETWAIPTSIALGLGYEAVFAEVHGVDAYLDFDYFYNSKTITAAIGAQYGFKDMVFARAGYHIGSQGAVLPSFASVGLGCKFFGVRLDASYTFANKDLLNTFTVGLGYSF